MNFRHSKIIKNSLILFFSLSMAWWIFKSSAFHNLIDLLLPVRFLAEILAGFFYTSFLTAPISVAMLVILAEEIDPIQLSVMAGFGAVLGDLLIIKLLRKRLFRDFKEVTSNHFIKKIDSFLKKNHLTFLCQVLGAIIVASPFPDELGLMLLGASDLKLKELTILTYALNSVGILLIILPISLI